MAKAENTIIFDGIQYNPGDELPDLGSWVCTDAKGMVRDYEGFQKMCQNSHIMYRVVLRRCALIRPNYTSITNLQTHGTSCKGEAYGINSKKSICNIKTPDFRYGSTTESSC